MELAGSSIRSIGMVAWTVVWLSQAGFALQPPQIDPAMKEAVEEYPLEAGWTIEPVSGGSPFPISLGDSWEKVLGKDFDGTAIYRCKLPAFEPQQIAQRRIWIELDGVATHAILRIEGKQVGEHLGAWTVWRIDVTPWYRPGLEIEVEVDERVGHNTQGFLPVFLPHFGGIWKAVRLLLTPVGGRMERPGPDRSAAGGLWRQRTAAAGGGSARADRTGMDAVAVASGRMDASLPKPPRNTPTAGPRGAEPLEV
jgi:hypothetical protein